jgi:hypothetical protein
MIIGQREHCRALRSLLLQRVHARHGNCLAVGHEGRQVVRRCVVKLYIYAHTYICVWSIHAMCPIHSPPPCAEFYLRERDQGILAQKSHEERKQSYGEELDKRARDAFYWYVGRGSDG